ncbi:MAG: glycosyltransferase family 2 protein [Planctomycetes bacterium]|nr:glycosyltransferase family 2 protein [Planctomycetota bacterium]
MDKAQNISLGLKKTVSAVIRVRNAAGNLQRCLAGLECQVLPPSVGLEIIVVDNGSTDESVDVARRYGATIVPIKAEEFTWGGALNTGVAKATGQIVLLLSSDAYAADSNWLCEMLKPFNNPNVAAVYGRQIPYRDAPVDERVRLKRYFPAASVEFNKNSDNIHPSGRGMVVSNACAAIRRDIWQEIPYDENITAGEEGLWSYEVLQRGYSTVYQASALVYHSHKDGPLKQAWRHWELRTREQLLDDSGKSKTATLRWMASFAKRRLRNCLHHDLPLSVRIKGLSILPAELIALAIVDFFPEEQAMRLKLKRLFWG